MSTPNRSPRGTPVDIVKGALVPESSLRFSPEDLQAFAAASRDLNPLHLSEEHARRSPFGERVVYGVLAGLKCLGRLSTREGWTLAGLSLEFPSAVFQGIPYEIEVDDAAPDRAKIRLRDGRRVVLRLSARFRNDASASLGAFAPCSVRTEAADLSLTDLPEGKEIAGSYSPDESAFRAFAASAGLEPRGLRSGHVAALMACSYLVGMELPGRRALFSGLKLDFEGAPGPSFQYRVRVDRRDDRFGLVNLSAQLEGKGAPRVTASLSAFVRPTIPPPDPQRIAKLLPPGESLKGQLAVVTGASRGLGASIAIAFASQGAQVIGTCRERSSAAEEVLKAARSLSGSLTLLPGDPADPAWWSGLRATLEPRGGLEFLVCNASPALRPLWLEPASAARVLDTVTRSVALVSTPLSCAMEFVEKKKGTALVVSSIAVREPPAEWPHYVAAKGAIEGLAQAASAEFPGSRLVIARPPKLITDLTNTPMGQLDGLSPDDAAAILVSMLRGPKRSGAGAEIFEDFRVPARP